MRRSERNFLEQQRENAIRDGRRIDAERQNVSLRHTNELQDLPRLPDDSDDGLTPIQRIAVGHLVCGQSDSATAMAMNISRRTIHRWKREEAFARVVELKSREALDAVATRARNLLLRGTRELERAFDRGHDFDHAMRVVNSKRIWDMANVMPKRGEEEPDKREAGSNDFADAEKPVDAEKPAR